jgi:flagellar export protein FliJ
MTGGVSAVRIRHYGAFFEKLRAVMLLQQSKIRKLETEKDKCLQKLIHVKREKMLLDKLREEQYSEYLSELKKQQANIMDDFISYRANVS